jgi:hypothetical protein
MDYPRRPFAPARLAALAALALVSTSPGAASGEEGARVEVELVPEQPEVMVGEPLHLTFRVRNRTDRRLQLLEGGDYRNRLGRPESFRLTVVDEHLRLVPVLDAGQSFGGLTGPRPLPARGVRERSLFLPSWVRLERPGTYLVLCATTLRIRRGMSDRAYDADPANDRFVVATALVRAVPTDAARMGALIEKLGRDLLGSPGSDRAERALRDLAAIEDERVIPHFVRAVGSRDYTLRFSSLRALSRFKSDEALRGIQLGMVTRGSSLAEASNAALAGQLAANIRQAAAGALDESPHPRAEELLLSMRRDPDPGVRLTVLHRLGRQKSATSLELVREMTRDRDRMVSDEAKRYLALRSH